MQCVVLPILLFLGVAGATRLRVAHRAQEEGVPTRLSKEDCFKKRPVFLKADSHVNKGNRTPGAGMTPKDIEPFETVLKDGYYSVACVKDHMYYFGDKFGNNKFDYKEGKISNTSIVLYSSIVPKQDQKPMSPAVCFSFCRTVPDMMFFGIVDGHKCYCSPFFKAMESGSGTCDIPCEGSPTQTCGSKVRSSIHEMHLCKDTAEELHIAVDSLVRVAMPLQEVMATARDLAEEVMHKNATKLQEAFGIAGDPDAAALTQRMKVEAGKLLETAFKPFLPSLSKAMELWPKVQSFVGNGTFSNFTVAQEAEETLATLMDLAATLAKDTNAAQEALFQVAPEALPDSPYKTTVDASKQYFDILYLTHAFVKAPNICTGTAVGQPLVATMDGCATACDREVHSCIGFDFMGADPKEKGFCFLFSHIDTVQYYTGCGDSENACASGFMCMVKFSEFLGTRLTPDPSGKCSKCLKKLTKADRCFDVPSSFAGCAGAQIRSDLNCSAREPRNMTEASTASSPPVPVCSDDCMNPGNCAVDGCHGKPAPACEDTCCGNVLGHEWSGGPGMPVL